MFSFEQLQYETEKLQNEELANYFKMFFSQENLDQYLISEKCDELDKTSIYQMFEEDNDIIERATQINKKDPFCLEAFYVLYRLQDDTTINVIFNDLLSKQKAYDTFNDYRKECFIKILEMYVEFLLLIKNITFAIKIQNIICELENKYSDINISKLSYMYAILEDSTNFYNLYINHEFNEIVPYLLLMVVLLKHEEELKAKEVLNDLINKYEYADFIDHVWDLEKINNEEANEFKKALDVTFDELCSIPYFFSWCSDNKEKSLKS